MLLRHHPRNNNNRWIVLFKEACTNNINTSTSRSSVGSCRTPPNNNNNNNNNHYYYSSRRFWSSSSSGSSSSNSGSLSSREDVATTTDHNSEHRVRYKELLTPSSVASLDPLKRVPDHIARPSYASSNGYVRTSQWSNRVMIHSPGENGGLIEKLRRAGQLAHFVLHVACNAARVGRTTDEIDTIVHETIVAHGAYPSPLNYVQFPKSVCASVNEVICHGIPNHRPLEFGDIVSFDVSCYLDSVHGDNCGTIIVGDHEDDNDDDTTDHNRDLVDWRGVPMKRKASFETDRDHEHFVSMRRLMNASLEGLHAGIGAAKPGNCLSDIGNAIHDVADKHGYQTIRKYRGHGIHHDFHCAPYVKHFRNNDEMELLPGMIFTIEPMFSEGIVASDRSRWNSGSDSEDDNCYEWDDQWTVATTDGSYASQFEHTVLITEDGTEILTQLTPEYRELLSNETK